MKKVLAYTLALVLIALSLTGCNKTLLSPDNPVTLTMWHVYGEQVGSPMDELIDEFNRTVGAEKGIIVRTTNMSNAYSIGNELLDAQAQVPGAPDMPDLFTCHLSNATMLGTENLLNWKDVLSSEELSTFVEEFLNDGMDGERLAVLPLSKSTHVLMLNGSGFDRFSAATGVTLESLSTWDGFFEAAEKYYEYSGGQTFCAVDYLFRAAELYALEHGADDFYTEDGWYDENNAAFKESWLRFTEAIGKGHISVSDLYSNTQVMTGEVLCGIGSSAAILYYNDTVTYADGSTEDMNFKAAPMPVTEGKTALMTQAGVGLCAYKTTEQKAEAAAVFAGWLTEKQRNLDFVAQTGYMPVRSEAFDNISEYEFDNENYTELYSTLAVMQREYTALSEPQFNGYYNKTSAVYDELRSRQKEAGNETDAAAFAQDAWELLLSVK